MPSDRNKQIELPFGKHRYQSENPQSSAGGCSDKGRNEVVSLPNKRRELHTMAVLENLEKLGLVRKKK